MHNEHSPLLLLWWKSVNILCFYYYLYLFILSWSRPKIMMMNSYKFTMKPEILKYSEILYVHCNHRWLFVVSMVKFNLFRYLCFAHKIKCVTDVIWQMLFGRCSLHWNVEFPFSVSFPKIIITDLKRFYRKSFGNICNIT